MDVADTKLNEAADFVRRAFAILGERHDEETVRRVAAKVLRALPPYPRRGRRVPGAA